MTASTLDRSYALDHRSADDLPLRHNSQTLNYEYITTFEQLQECVRVLADVNVTRVALDIETTGGLKPWMGSIRLIQLAVEYPHPRQFVIDCWHVDPAAIVPFIEDPNVQILACNARFEQIHMLYRYNAKIVNLYDVCYASQRVVGVMRDEMTEKQVAATDAILREVDMEIKALNELRSTVTGEQHETVTGKIDALSVYREQFVESAEKARDRKPASSFKALMLRYLQLDISKEQQTSAWHQEILTDDQLDYAAMDVAGLLDIYRQIIKDVDDAGVHDEVHEANEGVLASTNREMTGQVKGTTGMQRLGRAIAAASTHEQIDALLAYLPRIPVDHEEQQVLRELADRRTATL